MNLEQTIEFTKISTQDQRSKLLKLIQYDHRKVVRWATVIDSESFEPGFYCIALKAGENLSAGVRFYIAEGLAAEIVDTDYTNVDAGLETAKKIMDGFRPVEPDYPEAVITEEAFSAVVDDQAADSSAHDGSDRR
jgi:hypothetical protein